MKIQVFIAVAVIVVVITFLLDLRVAIPVVLLAPTARPVAVRLTARYARAPRFESFRPGVDPAPEPVRIYLASAENTLRGLGFAVVAYLRQTGFAANVTSCMVLLEHPEKGVRPCDGHHRQGRPVAGKQVTSPSSGAVWTEALATTNNSRSPAPSAPCRAHRRAFPASGPRASLPRARRAAPATGHRGARQPARRSTAGRGSAGGMNRELTAQVATGYCSWRAMTTARLGRARPSCRGASCGRSRRCASVASGAGRGAARRGRRVVIARPRRAAATSLFALDGSRGAPAGRAPPRRRAA